MPTEKASLTYGDYVKGVSDLKPEELLRLVEVISKSLKKALKSQGLIHSVMELEGLGAEIWENIDPKRHVERERGTWD